eukprot:7130_1
MARKKRSKKQTPTFVNMLILIILSPICIYNIYISQKPSIRQSMTTYSTSTLHSNQTHTVVDIDEYIKYDKIILICASGRSGSTSMQLILNTIPNSNICGENWGAVNHLLEYYVSIKNASINNIPGGFDPLKYELFTKNYIKPAWYNTYNFTEIQQNIKQMIVKMYKTSENISVWGFKEIRYYNGKIHLMKEFKELFPQTKVIIHVRQNINKQSRSSWFKRNQNKSRKFLANYAKELREFYENNRDFVYFSTFEEIFNPYSVAKIFKFLGEKFDKQKYKHIIKNNFTDYSVWNRRNTKQKLARLNKKKKRKHSKNTKPRQQNPTQK